MAHQRMIYQTDETRERILTKAQSMFVENGLLDTQMQDIARALDISRTSLYRYYRDKFELATAILGKISREVSSAWEEVSAQSPPRENGLEEVRFFFEVFWLNGRFAAAQAYMAEYDAFFSGGRANAAVREGIAQSMQPSLIGPLMEAVQRGIRDGSIRQDLDPHLAWVTLFNAVRSLQQRLILRGRVLIELQGDEQSRIMDELLRYLIDGIAAP